MAVHYACDYCGFEGRSSKPPDQIQCPQCGEPVTVISEDRR